MRSVKQWYPLLTTPKIIYTHKIITEVGNLLGNLLATPCYLMYTYSNNRGRHSANHTLLSDIHLQY